MLSKYNGKSPLPFLIGLIRIVNPIGNNSIKETLLEDYKFIKRATEIVKGISGRVKQDQYRTGREGNLVQHADRCRHARVAFCRQGRNRARLRFESLIASRDSHLS